MCCVVWSAVRNVGASLRSEVVTVSRLRLGEESEHQHVRVSDDGERSAPEIVTVIRWNVYDAGHNHVATYDNEPAAKAHCAAWSSGLTYSSGSVTLEDAHPGSLV